MISHTRQGPRFVTDTRDTGYDLLRALGSASFGNITCETEGDDLFRALGSASCDITHETKGATCYGHWVLHLAISHTRQGVRCVTGIVFCIL